MTETKQLEKISNEALETMRQDLESGLIMTVTTEYYHGLERQWDMLRNRCDSAITVFRDIKARHKATSFHNNRIASDCDEAIKFLEAALAACKEEKK